MNPYADLVPAKTNPYADLVPTSKGGKPPLLQEIGQNLVPDAKNFAAGVADAIVHPVRTLGMMNDAVNGAVLKVLPKELQWMATYDLTSLRNRDINDPVVRKMVDTANAIGGVYKDSYGTPEAIESTLRKHPVQFAADLSMLLGGAAGAVRGTTAAATKVARAAGATGAAAKIAKTGGAVSKTATVLADSTNPLTTNIVAGKALKATGNALAKVPGAKGVANALGGAGNVVGWLGPQKPMEVVAKGTAAGVGLVRNALAPKERALLTALEGEGPKVVETAKDRIKNNKVEIVPGSKPTLAEVVADLELTKLAQLDQSAKKHLSTQAARREIANEKVQIDQLGVIAKTDEDMKYAKDVREDESGPLYALAKEQVAKGDPTLMDIMRRPSMGRVMKRAAELAAEEGKPFKFGENTPTQIVPEKTVTSNILGPDGKPVQTTEPGYIIPAKFAEYKGDVLHYIKLAFDDEIKDIKAKFQPGVESEELRKIYATRNNFIDWMEQDSKIPIYGEARSKYEVNSQPIDRMLLGKYLKEKLEGAHGEAASANRDVVFENAVKDAPRTVKMSTGRKNVETLDEKLLPEEMDIVNNIREDIRRSELNKRLAKFGRGNDPDLKKMATDAVGNATPPPVFNPVVTAAKTLWEGLKGKLDERTAIRFATELVAEDLNVPVAAIEKALAHELGVKMTKQKVETTGKKIGEVLRTPAIYNALSPDRKEKRRNALSER